MLPFLGAAVFVLAPAEPVVDQMNGVRSSIRRAGDVNGDGVPDLLVSNSFCETPERVWIISGKDGSVLLHVWGRDAGDGFGHSMDGVGDVDGDGRADFVVAAPGVRMMKRDDVVEFTRQGSAYARIASGADGRVLHEFVPNEKDQRYGMCVAGAGDVDADGRPDVIIGLAVGDGGRAGEAVVISGRTGSVLRQFGELMRYGVTVSGCGDLDRDGHDDVLVGDGSAFNEQAGRLRAFSGKEGTVLFQVRTMETRVSFPWSLAPAGDLNGDGVPDVLGCEESQYVRAFSGKDGALLHEQPSHGRGTYLDAFGSSMDSVGDVDGDAVPDFLVGANESLIAHFDEGYATVCSGKDGHLVKELTFGSSGVDVSALGDVDGDHVPDFALCLPLRHQVQFVSGKSFETIREIDWTKLGSPVAPEKR
jgi:hypothetical protein